VADVTDTDVREKVRERYAAAATAVANQSSSGCCGNPVAEAGSGSASAFTDPDTAVADLHDAHDRRRRRGRPTSRCGRLTEYTSMRPPQWSGPASPGTTDQEPQ
jgi:hypothetical protein